MSGNRIVITMGIVLAILFALALFGFLTGRWDEAEGQAITDPPQMYQGVPLDAHLLRLDKQALETAYQQQLIFLFTTCLKDGCKNWTYFHNGVLNARRFHNEAAKGIAAREKELTEKGLMEDSR